MTEPVAPLLSGAPRRRGRPSRAASSAKQQHEGLGTSYLGSGLTGIALAIMGYELVVFLGSLDEYSLPALGAAAWLLLGATFGATVLAIRLAGQSLPSWAYAAFLAGGSATVVLDLAAVAGAGPQAAPTAAVAAAVAHAALIVHRRGVEIIVVALIVAAAELAVFAATEWGDPDAVSVRVTALVLTVTPAVVVVVMMRGFRRMVQLEIDRALVQSTTVGPRYAVGMLASEELARLDLAAERLLADVGDASTPLPLDSDRAAHAASLATQLRLHLIEGRRETWLHHAILESEFLAPLVHLDDPNGTAGLLGQAQRDGLLSAIWLILDGAVGTPAALHVEAGSPRESPPGAPARTLLVPIALRCEGVPLRGVDPATWEAIAQVGASRTPSRDSELRIEIDCLVENPVDR